MKIFSKAVNNLDGSQFTAATLNMSVHANLFLGVFWVIRPAYARAFSFTFSSGKKPGDEVAVLQEECG